MTKRSYKLFFLDILDSINKINYYTQNIDYKTFSENQMTIDAVIRNFEVMGEAVKNLPIEVKNRFPNVPFKKIAGMRDKLIHNYFGISNEIVWETIKCVLPEVKKVVEQVIKDIDE